MNRKLEFDLTNSDHKLTFTYLIAALNASGVTWGIEFDPCTNFIVIEIGEGY